MPHLVYGHDREVAAWVGHQLYIKDFGLCTGIGIASGNAIIGGAVYNNFHYDQHGKPLSIEMSFATIDKTWANRVIIYGLLTYPFSQLRLRRVQLTIARRNKHTRQFVERLGFKLEGIARKAHHSGTDAAVYSLLDGEWKASKWAKVHLLRLPHQTQLQQQMLKQPAISKPLSTILALTTPTQQHH